MPRSPAMRAGAGRWLPGSDQTGAGDALFGAGPGRARRTWRIPKGVFNIIVSDRASEVGTEMATNPAVRKLGFTGSTGVGKLLMQQAAGTVKKVSLELGGNAPLIIFDDADLDRAVEGAVACKYRNAGQTCVCTNRIFVQDSVYDAFAERFARAVGEMKQGNGFDDGVTVGPMITMAAVEKVEAHVADAVGQGAQVVAGGADPISAGCSISRRF